MQVQQPIVEAAQRAFGAALVEYNGKTWRDGGADGNGSDSPAWLRWRCLRAFESLQDRDGIGFIAKHDECGSHREAARKWLAWAVRRCWELNPSFVLNMAVMAPEAMIETMRGAPEAKNAATGAIAPGARDWETFVTIVVRRKVEEVRKEKAEHEARKQQAEREARGASCVQVPFVSSFDRRPKRGAAQGWT